MKYFYNLFKLITIFPGWKIYISDVYKSAIRDSKKMGVSLYPTARLKFLLCGVSGEVTADKFISFAFENFSNPEIIIIDLGDKQIKAVNELIVRKYSDMNIIVRQANALNLDFIPNNSIDWIDTDGFFSFFDENNLFDLLKEWKRILKTNGMITFRELTTSNLQTRFANFTRIFFGSLLLHTKLHAHTKKELFNKLTKLKYIFTVNKTKIPLLERYCLINK